MVLTRNTSIILLTVATLFIVISIALTIWYISTSKSSTHTVVVNEDSDNKTINSNQSTTASLVRVASQLKPRKHKIKHSTS